MVRDESVKTAKIMLLKNLALYGNCKRMNGKEWRKERSEGGRERGRRDGRREGKRWGGKEGGSEERRNE